MQSKTTNSCSECIILLCFGLNFKLHFYPVCMNPRMSLLTAAPLVLFRPGVYFHNRAAPPF